MERGGGVKEIQGKYVEWLRPETEEGARRERMRFKGAEKWKI